MYHLLCGTLMTRWRYADNEVANMTLILNFYKKDTRWSPLGVACRHSRTWGYASHVHETGE